MRPSSLSLSREPFSYTYCKGFQVFPLMHGSFHVISTQQGASFAGARNHSFQKNLYSSSNRLFSFTFFGRPDASYARGRNQPSPVKMKPSSETIYIYIYICHLHVASASAQPTMIVCHIHVLTFVLPCIILHRLLVIRVQFFLRYFVMFNLSLLNLSWKFLEYFLSIECNLPAAVP